MNKVTIINLNGRAYQIEEAGYNKLKQYLADGALSLEKDPDKDEIISDLEQAVAEKLDHLLSPNKTVILEKEIEELIKEMGPVKSGQNETPENKEEPKKINVETKRLYKIREGRMLLGVCNGLAAYFNMDVVLMRLIFVGLFLLTHGAWLTVYIVLAIVMPLANTSAEVAAAHGEPFTAQDFINRARDEYNKFSNKSEWKKWKREMKKKARSEKRAYYAEHYSGHNFLNRLIVVFVQVFWIIGLVSLIGKGMVFGYVVPASFPLWIAILIWLALYSFIVSAFKYGRSYAYYKDGHSYFYYRNNNSFMETMGNIAFIILIAWLVYQYIPASHIYFQQAGEAWNKIISSTR